jgi:SH3-like domain-containing protein
MRFWTSVGYIAFFGLIGFFVIGPFVEGKINDIRRGIKPKNKSAVSAPAVPGARKATVSAEAANFRDAPSTNSNVIKSLKKGTALTVTGAAAGGWLPVEYEGVQGYISADLVTNTDNR